MNRGFQYDEHFQKYGTLYNVDWRLLKAQAIAESALNPQAVSPVGAKGIAQFMDVTFEEYARKCKIENPDVLKVEHSIQCQAKYMSELLAHHHFDYEPWQMALCSYNWGRGNMGRVVINARTNHYTMLRDVLPKETVDYVERISSIHLSLL